MALPKFITVFNALHESEKVVFDKFILRHHDTKSEVYHIFCHIKKVSNGLLPQTDLKEIKGKKFVQHSDKNFANYLSLLYQLLEQWMVEDAIHHDENMKSYLLLKGFQKRGLYQLANKEYEDMTNRIHSTPNANYYHKLYEWLSHFEVYYSFNPHKYSEGSNAVHSLHQTFIDYTSYTAQILKTEIINWSTIYPYVGTADAAIMESFVSASSDTTHIQNFRTICELFKEFDKSKYDILVNQLLNVGFLHGSLEEIIITAYLIRLNIRSKKQGLNNDHSHYTKKLYDFAFKNGIFSEHGKVTPITFKNMILSVAENNSFEFSIDFVHRYIHYVHSVTPESTHAVCMATVYFKNEKYSEAIAHTGHTTYHDLAEKIHSLTINLLSWFMTRKSEPDIYQNVKNNYISFIKRNSDKSSEDIHVGFLNFILVINDLEREKSHIMISQYKNLQNRMWLTKYMSQQGIEIG